MTTTQPPSEAAPAGIRPTLRGYQQAAIDTISDLYDGGHHRATLVLPCGTGKTLTASTLTATADRLLVLVPTIALATQTAHHLSKVRPLQRLVLVCSPASRGETKQDPPDPRPLADSAAAGASGGTGGSLGPAEDSDDLTTPRDLAAKIGATLTTDPDTIAEHLASPGPVTLVATYASHAAVAEATNNANTTWDYLVCDEAHHTAGLAHKTWASVLDPAVLPASKRLFLTATPRELATDPTAVDETGEPIQVASMSNPGLYGPLIQPITLRDAINDGYLSDYRIAVVTVTEDEIASLVSPDGELLDDQGVDGLALTDPDTGVRHHLDPHTVATQIALLRYAAENPEVSTALVFHNRIAASRAWERGFDTITRLAQYTGVATPQAGATCHHLDGSSNHLHRDQVLTSLAATPPRTLNVVSNCRVLSEGVDVPALDAVVFAQPRTSAPDIVQAVGRCLRPHPAGRARRAVIVVPVLAPSDSKLSVEALTATTGYATVWQVLTALAHEDIALYRQLAWMRTNPTRPAPPGEEPMVEFSNPALITPELADQWRLRILNRTTSGWAVFATKMANQFAKDGNQYPRRGLRLADGYPIGERAHQIRRLHQDGRIHPQIVRFVEDTVPGWAWDPTPAKSSQRTWHEWARLLDHYVTHTGSTLVPQHALITDPRTGVRAPIGAWLHRQRQRWDRLTPDQQQHLTTTLNR